MAASLLGLIVGIFHVLTWTYPQLSEVEDALIAAIVAFMANVLAYYLPEIYAPQIVLSGLIVLIPGLSLTMAMAELSTQNLLSGSARNFANITSGGPRRASVTRPRSQNVSKSGISTPSREARWRETS